MPVPDASDMSAEDRAVAAGYAAFVSKGEPSDSFRITIMTAQQTYAVNEPVRVVHACESLGDGPLYVMGPKEVLGEYVDGELATAPGDALAPASYDGRVIPGPGVDFNYDITVYRFDTPGHHTIQWRLGPHTSNVVSLEVV